MMIDDSYQTIANAAEGLFKDRGSKFLAFAYPVKIEDDIRPIIQNLRELHPKAVHFCYAYRIGELFRTNDDSEPSGSAGKPILNVLLSKNVINILVVVVRYFGGTLLGVPGLINAYKLATEDALNQSEIITQYVRDVYRLDFKYELTNDVMKIVKTYQLPINNQLFDNECSIEIEIKKSLVQQIIAKFTKIDELRLNYQNTI
jgi:uncharacterized YigZ family protein